MEVMIMSLSLEQVIQHALDQEERVVSYYGEAELIVREGDEISEHSILKEWRSKDGEIRIEMNLKDGGNECIMVNNGEVLTSYQVDQNEAIVLTDDDMMSDFQPSLKEKVNKMLTIIKDTHDISVEGKEEIAGRVTYHLVAKEKDGDLLIGDQELWIDQEYGIALKMASTTGRITFEVTYTKVDFDREISEEKFVLDLPEDVDIRSFDDFSEASEVSLEEAVEKIGQPFLYFSEATGLAIAEIELIELKGEIHRREVNIEYEKDGLAYFTLTVFEAEDAKENFILPGEESIAIRGETGTMMDLGYFRSLVWTEKGITYSVLLTDPQISYENLVHMANDMELVE